LKSMLKSFSPASFSNWLIWQEGWVDWQELESVVDSLFPGIREKTNERPQFHSVPSMQPNSGVIAEQSPLTYVNYDYRQTEVASEAQVLKNPEVPQAPSTELKEESLALVEAPMPDSTAPLKQQERRANNRIQLPIKVFLHIDGSVIKNETVDVSLGGMKLKNPIGKEPKSSFDVTMLHQGVELALRCRLLTNEEEPLKSRLFIEKCNRIEILRSWIIEPKEETKKESA
jgi:PilZ domain